MCTHMQKILDVPGFTAKVKLIFEDNAITLKIGDDCGATAMQLNLDQTGDLAGYLWNGPGLPVASVAFGKGKRKEGVR